MGEVDGLSIRWSAVMAEKTRWALRGVNLTLSAADASSFVTLSLFGGEAEAAAEGFRGLSQQKQISLFLS